MKALTDKEIRRAFVNCSRNEAMAMTLPGSLDDVPWDEREFLGWRDPRAPLRGYAVWWRDGRPLGIALRAADSSMSSRSAASACRVSARSPAPTSRCSPPGGRGVRTQRQHRRPVHLR